MCLPVQVLPTLLNYLGLEEMDPAALDWGTIAVYTCSQSCSLASSVKPATNATSPVTFTTAAQSSSAQLQTCERQVGEAPGHDVRSQAVGAGLSAVPEQVFEIGTDPLVAYAEEFVWVQLLH